MAVSGLVSLFVGHCVRLVSLLSPFVSFLFPFDICLPALSCCVRLDLCNPSICLPALRCCAWAVNLLHLPPSAGLPCPPLPCNPVHLSLQSFAFVSQLWTAVSAPALQSFVSQLWTSQALVAECSDCEKHKLFGVYGGVITITTGFTLYSSLYNSITM